MENKKEYLYIIIAICLIVGGFAQAGIKHKDLIADELAHAIQVDNFVKGNYSIVPKLTVIPGYHFIISSIAKVLNVSTLNGYRLINFFFLLFCLIPIFYVLCNCNVLRTLQFFFFPLMFMFYFLVYTDLFSLMLILLMFLCMKNKWYYHSAFIGLISMFVRQNNLIWVGFICMYIFFEDFNNIYKQKIKSFKFKDSIIIDIKLKNYLKKVVGYIISILIFGSYILYKGKIVMDDNTQHPIAIHLTNIWFLLFLFFFLFFPIILIHIKEIFEFLNKNKKYYILLLGIFLVGLGSFNNSHYYNHIEGIWFNILLEFISSNILFKIIVFLIIILTIGYLLIIKIEHKWIYYLCTIIFLMFSWLVEPRYYFIPLTFFMMLRKEENKKIEWFLLVYYILTGFLFYLTLLKS